MLTSSDEMHSHCPTDRDELSEPLVYNAVTESLQSSGLESVSEYRDYYQRWYMLAVVALLNLSSGMVCFFRLFTFACLLLKLTWMV
jgi:hypothetical protein